MAQGTAGGVGFTYGGNMPDVPLHGFPLLAWMHDGHEKFGKDVFTEDQKASVPQIAEAFKSCGGDLAATARMFGTTTDHAIQAVGYARVCGVLKE